MSDNIKRFRLSDDDRNDISVFTPPADDWQIDINSSGETQQYSSLQDFFSKFDCANAFPTSPSEPIYDLCDIPSPNPNPDPDPHPEDKVETDHKKSTETSKKANGTPKRSTVCYVSTKKKSKKAFALRDVGRWKPSDDLLLIIGVLQVNDLDIVFSAIKFSCKFTYGEIQKRWNALLYDELVSRTSRAAIRKMHPEQQEAVHRRAPFSLAEEDLLCDITSTDNPSLEDFQNLLDKNAGTFYHSRTDKTLQNHWRLLRKYELLCDQRPNKKYCAAGEMPPSFSDAEAELTNENLIDFTFNGHIDQEIKLLDQQMKRKARLLEDELGHWMQLLGVPSEGVDATPQFGYDTFAILRGERLRYSMRTRFISFGRQSKAGEEVDVDLSIEGPVQKVSRYQGGIEFRGNGFFYASNFGKRPFFVDGRPVFPRKTVMVRNNSTFDVFGINFTFLINRELVEDICFNDLDTD